jgi:hypothetical protein
MGKVVRGVVEVVGGGGVDKTPSSLGSLSLIKQGFLRNVRERGGDNHICEEVSQQKKALLDSGFIGSFKASPDLSVTYKRVVKEAVDTKYPKSNPVK